MSDLRHILIFVLCFLTWIPFPIALLTAGFYSQDLFTLEWFASQIQICVVFFPRECPFPLHLHNYKLLWPTLFCSLETNVPQIEICVMFSYPNTLPIICIFMSHYSQDLFTSGSFASQIQICVVFSPPLRPSPLCFHNFSLYSAFPTPFALPIVLLHYAYSQLYLFERNLFSHSDLCCLFPTAPSPLYLSALQSTWRTTSFFLSRSYDVQASSHE